MAFLPRCGDRRKALVAERRSLKKPHFGTAERRFFPRSIGSGHAAFKHAGVGAHGGQPADVFLPNQVGNSHCRRRGLLHGYAQCHTCRVTRHIARRANQRKVSRGTAA